MNDLSRTHAQLVADASRASAIRLTGLAIAHWIGEGWTLKDDGTGLKKHTFYMSTVDAVAQYEMVVNGEEAPF